MVSISSCSLNNVDSDIGPKAGLIADDVDFSWDLWPELEENQPLQEQKIDLWPELKKDSILFLGDESLQANWGLLIQKAFVKLNQSSWFLSTCMSARDFKNGGISSCGFWTKPFHQEFNSPTYITLNQTPNGERLAPKIISDINVNTVVISFGHRISIMESVAEIQMELSAIELLAKWAHSSGKKCYVIEPRDSLYIESEKSDFLTIDETAQLKLAVSNYCDWIDAETLKNDFMEQSKIPVDQILSIKNEDVSQGYVSAAIPELNTNTALPINENISSETMNEVNEQPNVQPREEILAPLKSKRPKARPKKITMAAQIAIKEQLEAEKNEAIKKNVVQRQSSLEPQYLWNGHNNGAALTEIGRSYLQSSLASYLIETRDLRDVENFCPNYWNLNKTNRMNFWLYLYSAIARFENDKFNPRALHKEKKSGRHSIGIFQVDTKNCGYGSDANKAELFDLDKNFKCALSRGTSLVKKGRQVADGRFANKKYIDFGLDGYWSVLRRPYKGAAMNSRTGRYENAQLGRRDRILNMTRSIDICLKP